MAKHSHMFPHFLAMKPLTTSSARLMQLVASVTTIAVLLVHGCAARGPLQHPPQRLPPVGTDAEPHRKPSDELSQGPLRPIADLGTTRGDSSPIQLVVSQQEVLETPARPDRLVDPAVQPAEPIAPGDVQAAPVTPTLDGVIQSVYANYPLLAVAMQSRDVAAGNQLAAQGEFDLKLKASTENGPLGFYETYRHGVGLVQPLYSGREVFAGYRVGRGNFQPWYLERQTDEAGEFKAGILVPMVRNRSIDQRRANLWRATYDRQLAEPEIHAQLIGFIQEASYAYWDWVAAGQLYEIWKRTLDLAEQRVGRIEQQVQAGLVDPPELTDNRRLIAERRAKLAEARQKLQQKGAKLSLYLRDDLGQPQLPPLDMVATFADPDPVSTDDLQRDLVVALQQRPELRTLDISRRQLEVDLSQAENDYLPEINAAIAASDDVGEPTSSKKDKAPTELEAAMFLDMPIQRRKSLGKIAATRAKIGQLTAKRRMVTDKISVELQSAYAALTASYQQVVQTREGVRLSEDLAQRERRNFEEGASDLLKVTLREQYAFESAAKEVEALLQYHLALADYRAVLASDQLPGL